MLRLQNSMATIHLSAFEAMIISLNLQMKISIKF